MRKLPLSAAIAGLPLLMQVTPLRADDSVLAEVTVRERAETRPAGRAPAASDTTSLLGWEPGVSTYSAGGVSALPVIHGMADDRLRVKVDGMDLIAACPNHMNSPLSYVDPSSVARIQVHGGLSPVSVGGDSIGGSILVETPAPAFAAADEAPKISGEAGAYYRSNGDAKGAHLATSYATESIQLSYSASVAQSDNYKAAADFKSSTATGRNGHTLPLDEVGSTAYLSRNQTLGLATRIDNHVVELKFGYQDVPYELYPNQRMDMLGNTEHRFNLRDQAQFDWGSLETRLYYESVRHHMDFGADKQYYYGTAPLIAPGMPMDTESKNGGGSIKASIDLGDKGTLRIGGEYQNFRLNDWWPPSPSVLPGGTPFSGMAPDTFLNINNGRRERAGLFGEWEGRLAPQWQGLFGLRLERVTTNADAVHGYNGAYAGYAVSAAAFNARDRKRSDDNLDLTAVLTHAWDAERSLAFGYSRKTRSPNLYERYSWSQNGMALVMNNFVGDGNGYLGNPDLKPEVAHTLSATLDWHDETKERQLLFTPYVTYVTNYIDANRCRGSGAGMNAQCGGAANNTATNAFVHLQYANHAARLYGFDLSGQLPLGRNGWGEWGLKGLLNVSRGENLDSKDNLYNIVPLHTKLALTHRSGNWDNSVEWFASQAKTAVSSVRQEIPTPGYGLVNLRASYQWAKTRLDFGIENLFNKFYVLPQGGAYAGQGRTMSASGIPWGIAVPGPGQSIYTALSYKF